MKIGDLIKWTHRGTLTIYVHLGIVIEFEDPSVKVRWEDGRESWMNVAWLEIL